MKILGAPDTRSTALQNNAVVETFSEPRPAGSVIGTRGPGGAPRLGRDVERRIGIDHGALRFQPLITPGWGRQGIAYGPFRREPGLALFVSITNGHNTSQGSAIPEDITRRLWRWARGPNADSWPTRMLRLVIGPRKHGLLRRFTWWLRSTSRLYRLPEFNENLAIGWFTTEGPADPLNDGCGLIVHAALGDSGELWIRLGNSCLRAFRRLKNLRIYYVVVLQERGAIYYAAAASGAYGLVAFPNMRPIAVDPFNRDRVLYAGVHQCALGQIGFRVDTRVHGIHIEQLTEFAGKGTAQVFDDLIGDGPLVTAGGAWRIVCGAVYRTADGAKSGASRSSAVVDASVPSGLVHALIENTGDVGSVGLIWRFKDSNNHWRLELSERGTSLVKLENGVPTTIAIDAKRRLGRGPARSVQITDFSGRIGCYLDAELLFDAWIEDGFGETEGGVGLWFDGNGCSIIRDFQAHPRQVAMPNAVRFDPPWCRRGKSLIIVDRFVGSPGVLAGRSPEHGAGQWKRIFGSGSLNIVGSAGAKVRASVAAPNPGRTFHTLPWPYADFADLEATIIPPGTSRGQREHCRSGLVFWQDKDNYLSFTAYLADEYQGASVALFTKRHGFEELYDAIWTMVADGISWGRPFRLRVSFDGNSFLVHLNGEPIMERSLTDIYCDDPPLRISQVGLATNWEWGDDTGSTFKAFAARY